MTGVAYESVAWIYKMFITLIIAVIAIGIVGITMKTDVNTIEIQKTLMLNRIIYGSDSFLYTDSEGVVYPGIIDASKFTQERLDANFVYPDNYGGAMVILSDGTDRPPIYVNKKTYDGLRTTIVSGVGNSGTVEMHNYPVTVRDGTVDRRGYLSVELVMPEKT